VLRSQNLLKRSECKDKQFGGAVVCPHQHIRSRCKECVGAGLCHEEAGAIALAPGLVFFWYRFRQRTTRVPSSRRRRLEAAPSGLVARTSWCTRPVLVGIAGVQRRRQRQAPALPARTALLQQQLACQNRSCAPDKCHMRIHVRMGALH